VARRAWQEAALALATVEASRKGRPDLVRKGLAGLRGLGLPSTGAPGTAEPQRPPENLTRAQIQEKFLGLARASASRDVATLNQVAAFLSGAIAAAKLFGNAIGNPNDKATYTAVLDWIKYGIDLARGSASAAAPADLSPDAVLGLAGFCAAWTGVAKPLAEVAVAAGEGLAIGNISLTAAILVVSRILISVGDGICRDPQLQAGGTTTVGSTPSNCPTLECPTPLRGAQRLRTRRGDAAGAQPADEPRVVLHAQVGGHRRAARHRFDPDERRRRERRDHARGIAARLLRPAHRAGGSELPGRRPSADAVQRSGDPRRRGRH
jgi:hypothetical protein